MTVHVLHAGDGYTYLTRQVATADARRESGQSLADYYTAQGNPPGRWLGEGLTELGVSGEVSEAQMKALYGAGAHPNADSMVAERTTAYVAAGESPEVAADRAQKEAQLGRAFPSYEARRQTWGQTLKLAYAAEASRRGVAVLDLDPATRAQVRDRTAHAGFLADRGRIAQDDRELKAWITARSRPAHQAVAGYDLVFTPVKSVSVLWALAPDEVRREVAQAHEVAVRTAMAYIEDHAAKTRTGAGGLAQIDTRGLLAAAFDHRDSRTGDPNLHTHVAVSTKVQGVDGEWRSLDGRLLFALAVSASEIYTTAVEDELRARLGVSFADRPGSHLGRRPVREIEGVDPRLMSAFSSRRADIEVEYGRLLAMYRTTHGREPDRSTQAKLAQEATLATRTAKADPRSHADQRGEWITTASAVLRVESSEVEQRLAVDTGASVRSQPSAFLEVRGRTVLAEVAEEVVRRVGEERSTWNRWHVQAEVERQLRPFKVQDRDEREALTEQVTHLALAASISLTAPPTDSPGEGLVRESDGASIFTVHGSDLFTSLAVLEAETRLLEAGRAPRDADVSSAHMRAAADALTTDTATALAEDQLDFASRLATSNTLLSVGIGPAGAGKTTALRLLSAAVMTSGHRVVALAPSAMAATVLSNELDVDADTLHKYLHTLDHAPEQLRLGRGDVLLVDEAGMAGTLRLDQLTQHASDRGARVVLVGDPNQLTAVEAGGALRLLVHDLSVAKLTTLQRFAEPYEAQATLQLRSGDVAAIDFYDDNARLHGGALDQMVDTLYEQWRRDNDRGQTSLMLSGRSSVVRELSARARLDRIAAGQVDPTRGIRLHDGTTASPGDLVVTRRNDRQAITHQGRDFVKNGDVWRVRSVRDDGQLELIHTQHGGHVTLGRDYVSDAVELAYAATIHRAQGTTADSAHVLVDGSTTREALYVAASRGRSANHLYAVTDHALDIDVDHAPTETLSARDVIHRAMNRVAAEKSATETLRESLDDSRSLSRLIPEYQHVHRQRRHKDDTLAPVVHATLGSKTAARVLADPAWPATADALLAAADSGVPTHVALHEAADRGGLEKARSAAQLVTWRVQLSTQRAVQRATLTAGLPSWAFPPPPEPQREHLTNALAVEAWLVHRATDIRQRVDELVESTISADEPWSRAIPDESALLRDLVAYRDQYAIRDSRNPLGVEPSDHTQRRLWRALSQRVESASEAQKSVDDLKHELSAPLARQVPRVPRI